MFSCIEIRPEALHEYKLYRYERSSYSKNNKINSYSVSLVTSLSRMLNDFQLHFLKDVTCLRLLYGGPRKGSFSTSVLLCSNVVGC
jgi:hypothetical protein